MKPFKNRQEAGEELASWLHPYKKNDTLVLALPRGGVPVAYEIAKQLKCPLDVLLVRKLGVPHHEELAMGALAENDVCFLNDEFIHRFTVSQADITSVINKEKKELARRINRYRQNRPLPALKNKNIILVDDGVATGATLKAAITALKQMAIDSLVVAVPVGSYETIQALAQLVDVVICPLKPEPFYSVSQGYQTFPQVSDTEVCECLSLIQDCYTEATS